MRIVTSGDVDGKIETHLGETVINGRGGKNAGVGVFDAESFEDGFEVLQNPFGRFAVVAADEDFDAVVGVFDYAADDGGEKVRGEFLCWLADTVGTEVFHNKLLKTLMVNIISSAVLPRERSARGVSKPWMRGPAMVKPPKRSRDL